MKSRVDLHRKLVDIFGCDSVYYQPPESMKMVYPCIRYTKGIIESRYADDIKYLKYKRYEITVIDKNPDNPVIEELLNLPLSKFDRHYKADNLNHDVITIYY